MEILLIEDDPADARLLREMFNDRRSPDVQLVHVELMSDAEALVARNPFQAILLDLGLPDAEGIEAVQRIRLAAPRTPLIVLTGRNDESMATRTLQEGAQDYLLKGQIDAAGLLRAIRYAIERKATQQALMQERELAQVTLNCLGEAVTCTDTAGNITFMNLAAETMSGWRLHEARGRHVHDIFLTINALTRRAVGQPIAWAIRHNEAARLPPNCVVIRRDGVEVPIENSIAAIHDQHGDAVGAVIVFRDVSIARAMAFQISHLAEHDFLTDLPNRMLLNTRIEESISTASRQDERLAILFLDLDGFKHINDSLGHQVGDRLLQSVSKRLKKCVRASDTVSRQGGDEFVILLSGLNHPDEAAMTARSLLDAIADTHLIGEEALHVTTSIGISIYPDDGIDAQTLIKNADTAMYQAKENGRQNYQFFEPAMSVRAVERQSIEESLRRALQREEFSLSYQPKIDLATGEITGAEALIRWTHPTRGALPPHQFIPIAEDCGLILPISRWVLREACRQAQSWLDAGLPRITMAVNISAIDFRAESFLENVTATLADTGFNPNDLELELTESVLMKRAEHTEAALVSLRASGVKLSVDDFGTGYSSLSYLRQFSIDALKIDQSFIRQITATPHETTLVAAMISMGRSLKLRVIAEGVETAEELAFLKAHRCDEAQGYFFSRPVTPDRFAALLAGRPFRFDKTGDAGYGMGSSHGG